MQQAAVLALSLEKAFYLQLQQEYIRRRDFLIAAIRTSGLRPYVPAGAYYIMADISSFGFPDDMAFTRYLLEQVQVAAVPGSSFFEEPRHGAGLIRFCFCKKSETLALAGERLRLLCSS
jgi:aspartate/methionine/tyrosine aminotransferase